MDALSVSLEHGLEGLELWAKFIVKLQNQEFSSFFIQIDMLDTLKKRDYCDFVNHKRNLFECMNSHGSSSFYWLSDTTIRFTVAHRGGFMEGTSMITLPFDILKGPMTELADVIM